MKSERWEGVKEEGCEFVEAVEDEAVVPDDDGAHERAHAEDIVGLEPGQVVGEKKGLCHHGKVQEVAEVQHEQLVLVLT